MMSMKNAIRVHKRQSIVDHESMQLSFLSFFLLFSLLRARSIKAGYEDPWGSGTRGLVKRRRSGLHLRPALIGDLQLQPIPSRFYPPTPSLQFITQRSPILPFMGFSKLLIRPYLLYQLSRNPFIRMVPLASHPPDRETDFFPLIMARRVRETGEVRHVWF